MGAVGKDRWWHRIEGIRRGPHWWGQGKRFSSQEQIEPGRAKVTERAESERY